ncbi:MAG: dinitrogenase iron-molybdenum cofactor biosynthesis protein [Methanosarcinaceae archaeon]|nr:dinitrogenase iron-molybdenum cofactor biosynthesis protein [Methanosarcinaceae archaeon]
MKIAITSSGDNLDSQMDPRFGRCQYFVIVDPDTMDFEAMQNESAMASGGAGIQAAQTIVNVGINAVITGNVGPNAFEVLSASGIETMTGASGTVRQALELYKSGSLQSSAGATVGAHAGMPLGMDSGEGAGQAPITKEQKISMLEDELEQSKLQLAQIKNKLEDMKK